MAGFLSGLRRAVPSIVISSLCFSAIYFDYTHTQAWKQQVKLEDQLIAQAKNQA